jgi:hypothetical protein
MNFTEISVSVLKENEVNSSALQICNPIFIDYIRIMWYHKIKTNNTGKGMKVH